MILVIAKFCNKLELFCCNKLQSDFSDMENYNYNTKFLAGLRLMCTKY